MMNCPCYNCICVPVCKHKSFHNLYFNCSLLSVYISSCDRSVADDESSWARFWIHNALNPSKWGVDSYGNVFNESGGKFR